MERECSQGFRVEIFEENTTRSLTERSSKLDRGVVDRLPLAPFRAGGRNAVKRATLVGVQGGKPCWVSIGSEATFARAKPLGVKGTPLASSIS